MDNIDRFNTLVGLIFDELYREFPQPKILDLTELARKSGVSVEVEVSSQGDKLSRVGRYPDTDIPFMLFAKSTLIWLFDEGFTRSDHRHSVCHVLSAKALTALNATPDAVGGKSIGKQLGELAKTTGGKAASSAWGELVGQVIGGIAKGIFT